MSNDGMVFEPQAPLLPFSMLDWSSMFASESLAYFLAMARHVFRQESHARRIADWLIRRRDGHDT
jgi:hypothetical protein